MNKIHLSKSKYCKGVQCEKVLWLSKYNSSAENKSKESVFKTGRQVGELAKGLFGDYEDIPYNKNLSVMIEKTEKLLKDKPNIITEASFSFKNNFCSVDILKNDVDGVEIYEVKSSTSIKDIYYDDAGYQYFVLSNLGLNVKKVCIVYINTNYSREEELDINQLFNFCDVTDKVKEKQDEIRNNINKFNDFIDKHDKDNEPKIDIGIHCFNPYDCDFWEYCTKELPKPNIFDLTCHMKKATKFKKYYEGKISFKDLQPEELSDKCMEQIDFELNNRKPKIIKEEIKKFLNQLKYPLYFIDYETCNPAIPILKETHPYKDQIPFQYSLHIIQNEGLPIEHKEFLAEIDDENMIRTFAESMIKNLPENGSVIAYNASFESTCNKKIGEMYPDLEKEIERINSNIEDIKTPFSERWYYTKEMKGSASLKSVLPALYPELNYDNLEIHDGGEASDAFLSLKDATPEDQEKTRKDLLEYCKLDTLAMVNIWKKLKEVTGDD